MKVNPAVYYTVISKVRKQSHPETLRVAKIPITEASTRQDWVELLIPQLATRLTRLAKICTRWGPKLGLPRAVAEADVGWWRTGKQMDSKSWQIKRNQKSYTWRSMISIPMTSENSCFAFPSHIHKKASTTNHDAKRSKSLGVCPVKNRVYASDRFGSDRWIDRMDTPPNFIQLRLGSNSPCIHAIHAYPQCPFSKFAWITFLNFSGILDKSKCSLIQVLGMPPSQSSMLLS